MIPNLAHARALCEAIGRSRDLLTSPGPTVRIVGVDMLESGPQPGSRSRIAAVPRWRLAGLGSAGTARGVAVAAGLALLAAEVLPWGSLAIKNNQVVDGGVDISVSALTSGLTLHAVELPAGIAVAFQLGWALLLAAFAVALYGPPRLRRTVSAAAAGLAVGQVALLAGVVGSSSDTAGMFSLFGAGPISAGVDEFNGHQGPGMFCAGLAALLALFAAGVMARDRSGDDAAAAAVVRHRAVATVEPADVWRPGPGVAGPQPADPGAFDPAAAWPAPEPVGGDGRVAVDRRGRRDPWDEDDLGPADLTVTAVPPNGYRRPGR